VAGRHVDIDQLGSHHQPRVVFVQSPRPPAVSAKRLEESGAGQDAAIKCRDHRFLGCDQFSVEPDHRHAHMLTGAGSEATGRRVRRFSGGVG
jgi:hypothetical protein